MQNQGNKVLGIVGIVLGAFAIVFAFWYMVNIAALIAGIVGIVLAVLSKKSFAAAGQSSPIPTVALVLSIIGTVFAVIGFFTCTVCVCAAAGALEEASKDPNFASQLSSALVSSLESLG